MLVLPTLLIKIDSSDLFISSDREILNCEKDLGREKTVFLIKYSTFQCAFNGTFPIAISKKFEYDTEELRTMPSPLLF